jgi:hypothetical protein
MNLTDLHYFQTIARCGNITGSGGCNGCIPPCPGGMMLSTSPIAPMAIARAPLYVSKMRSSHMGAV